MSNCRPANSVRWVLQSLVVVLAAFLGVAGFTVLLESHAGSTTTQTNPSDFVDDGSFGLRSDAFNEVDVDDLVGSLPLVDAVGVVGRRSSAGEELSHARVFVAPNTAGGTTRVGRWMSSDELAEMSSTGRVVEGGGGRTFVVEPPNPSAYPSERPGPVYAEFDVATDALSAASKLEWSVIPGPNVTTRIYGPPPLEMPPATCIVCVAGN